MFEDDVAFAKKGEEIVWLGLLQRADTKQVLDVRNDKYFQAFDVDFLQLTTSGKCNKIEVKIDRQAHETGNIVYETKSKTNVGCLERSIADIVIYCINGNGKMYGFVPDVVRKYIELTRPKEIEMGEGAMGYLLNIKEMEKLKVIREINYVSSNNAR